MEEDMILQPISMDTEEDTRSAWKTSGLFSNNEIRKETNDEVLKDFQRNVDDCLATDLNYSSLLPMPYYEMPQPIQPNAELDIPTPSVLDEGDWDLGSFDVENNIDCDIFAELSDLATTVGSDENAGLKPEPPPVASKPSDSSVASKPSDSRDIRSIKNPVSESSPIPATPRSVANNFLDHNYASVVPKSPAVHPDIENACAASCEQDVGETKVSKTMKYVERRKKNNLASRRSRETRKRKYAEMQEEVFQLERKNDELRNQIAKMEWMSCTMKRSLFGKIDVPYSFTD